jgi:hypothetical protein
MLDSGAAWRPLGVFFFETYFSVEGCRGLLPGSGTVVLSAGTGTGVLICRGIGAAVLGGLLIPGRGTVVLSRAEAGVATGGGSASLSDSNVRSTKLLGEALHMLGAVVSYGATGRRDNFGRPVLGENGQVVERVNVPQRPHHEIRTTRPSDVKVPVA